MLDVVENKLSRTTNLLFVDGLDALPGADRNTGSNPRYDSQGRPPGTTQICMARSDLSKGPPLPGNWEKLYNGNFGEPGLGGKETPVVDPNSTERVRCMYPHVIYSQILKKYILTININRNAEIDEGMPRTKSGIYLNLTPKSPMEECLELFFINRP